MEREAIFRDNLLFFMGWDRKGLHKGRKRPKRQESEKRARDGREGVIYNKGQDPRSQEYHLCLYMMVDLNVLQ